ncbi:hypothetical protein Tco_1225678, partial [Tanacetum coccineum]
KIEEVVVVLAVVVAEEVASVAGRGGDGSEGGGEMVVFWCQLWCAMRWWWDAEVCYGMMEVLDMVEYPTFGLAGGRPEKRVAHGGE